ncbi:endonuclease III domain-containing protein [Citrifermentans pelophilum]|uniref:endonuclease III domain-containing protein n=1 Tax=Geoanaerobacter pelophilus TaxID=60036 RepID=UPI001FE9523B|nr:endonuclease III domain-containing protein [Geoanaerobacter pelophilus]
MTERLLDIYARLYRHFGPCNWWPADSPFEVCVGAILTQNTNWGNVEKAVANLKRGGVLSPDGLKGVSLVALAEMIRPAGYFNVKSRRLKSFVDWLWDRYDGSIDRMSSVPLDAIRDELLAVHGVGRETCDSILLYAGNYPTFVVDAYTGRLFSRLGVIDGTADYETTRTLFMTHLQADVALYNEFHALIVLQCKEFCRKKPVCGDCILKEICGTTALQKN